MNSRLGRPKPLTRGNEPDNGVVASRDDSDERWTTEYSTVSYDPELFGIGSSPWLGDTVSSCIQIPAVPSTPTNRYMFVLAGMSVLSMEYVKILGLRQAVEIGSDIVNGDGDIIPFRIPVETKDWRFIDGNIAWGLRIIPGSPRRIRPNNSASGTTVPGIQNDPTSIYPGLLQASAAPYVPPSGGVFPGWGPGSLGLFRDLRFPWVSQGAREDINLFVHGPCDIVFYASVKQTDPANRPSQGSLGQNSNSYATKEQLFLADHSNARYATIAGSIIMEKSIGRCGNDLSIIRGGKR